MTKYVSNMSVIQKYVKKKVYNYFINANKCVSLVALKTNKNKFLNEVTATYGLH